MTADSGTSSPTQVWPARPSSPGAHQQLSLGIRLLSPPTFPMAAMVLESPWVSKKMVGSLWEQTRVNSGVGRTARHLSTIQVLELLPLGSAILTPRISIPHHHLELDQETTTTGSDAP